MPSEEGRRDLRDYLAVMRRRRWIIVAATILVAGTALALSIMQTPIYRAGARVLLTPGGSLFDNTGQRSVTFTDVQTEIQVIGSQPVLDLAREKLGSGTPRVQVVPVGQTSVLEIRAQSTSPETAATVANTYAESYIEYTRKQGVSAILSAAEEIQRKADEVQGQVDNLSNQLAALPSCTGNNPPPECSRRLQLQEDRDAALGQLTPLKQRLNELDVDAAFNTGGPRLITPAAVPTTPFKPTPKRNAILGMGVGLLFGTALAFAFEHFDDSIKTKEDLERAARDVTVLGLIPLVPGWKNRDETYLVSRNEPSSPAAEAYRALRTSIHFLTLDRSMKVLMVTSPNASEGKSTAVANLGVVLARAGARVIVVSCDLRRPRIHEFFGLPNSAGFTSVLLGEAQLPSVILPVPGEDRLSLLPAGHLPPNPSELLASNRTSELIDWLRSQADIVLLDVPPVLPVTDAAVLSARADGVLLVATVEATTGKHFARAVELLRQVGAPLVGTILNGVSAEGAYGYTYQYYAREVSRNGRSSGRQRKQPAKP